VFPLGLDLVGVAGEANSRALMPASMLSSFITFKSQGQNPAVTGLCVPTWLGPHTTHYTLHTLRYALHTTHCTLHTTHYTLNTSHCTDLVGVAGEANSRALMPASMLSSFIAFDVSLRQVPGLVSIFIYQYTW
jgi:hypothetical protein